MLEFLEDYDTVFLGIVGFSVIFFIFVITKATIEVRRYMEKEKRIKGIEDRYDQLRQHRKNLIVKLNKLFSIASLLLG